MKISKSLLIMVLSCAALTSAKTYLVETEPEYNNPDVIHDGFGQINEQINYENDPVAINDPDPAAAAPLATAPAVAAPAATAPAAATPAAAPAAAAPGAAAAPAAAWYPKTVY